MTNLKKLKLYRRTNNASSFLIRVTSRENTNWQGEIEHIQSGEVIKFRNLLELISLVNEMTDMLDFPQATFQTRTWEEQLEEIVFDIAVQ